MQLLHSKTAPALSVNGTSQNHSQGTPHPRDFEHASIIAATDHIGNPTQSLKPDAAAGQPNHRRSSDAAITDDHDEAEVPREARLLCDAQGKLIFIGDCAPLSFFQTVRQLVTSRVDQNAFAPQTSRYSVLENATTKSSFLSGASAPPELKTEDLPSIVSTYFSVTSGMVDLFIGESRLLEDITIWASNSQAGHRIDDVSSAVNYLVIAIGMQQKNEETAQLYFEYARDQALANMNGNLSADTVQAFILVTLYMLCACQINGAFLFFGIAVRAAYSIGVHRTEVNSRFGPETHRQRDRLWKSLRIVDLFLSTSMGRPPNTSDVDCTVPYRQVNEDGHEVLDILNASVQIFLILEGVVLEVYSRRKITLQLTEGISRQLRDFSGRWLHLLKNLVSSPNAGDSAEVNGACQVLASYYYAVMLVSRPFLMYELYRRLSPEPSTVYGRAGLMSGKSKLADACIDAASLMVDQILDLMEKGYVSGRRPVLVSWLFAGSLVLGAGLLGGFGRILEKYARMSVTALDRFSKIDAHAAQYSMISNSLLTTAVEYLEKKESQERLQRTESSAQLFGLIPHEPRDADSASGRRSPDVSRRAVASPMRMGNRDRDGYPDSAMAHNHHAPSFSMGSPFFADLDPAFLSMSSTLPRTPDLSVLSGAFEGDDSSFGGLNLFPLLDTGGGGHIDLAHYL
ncbi:Filamentous growth regulator 27 [Cytospora mali]|uniref:Filamentous growth regulator 27 n=1 Tax=Cytospora mali TaxID=578113 RepID=A0A194VQL0_CYTMA|nr:Filamentous growth regulator 27 [Valsa mali]